MPEFLEDLDGARPWRLPPNSNAWAEPASYFLGQGTSPLEIAVATCPTKPGEAAVRALWKARHGNTPSPLLLVVLYPSGADWRVAVCGPVGEDPAVHLDQDCGHAERLAILALAEPDRHAATRFLTEALQQLENDLAGIHNVGMFASHELRSGVPARPDWDALCRRGRVALGLGGRDLVEALGFEIEARGITTHVLRVRENGRAAAVAVFLERGESAEAASARFQESSPVTHALARADQERLDYVVLTRGTEIRVYSARKHAGIGRRGRADTYVEANVALMSADLAGYLPLLFGSGALEPGGTFEQVLERSRDFAAGLGARLRDRVYQEVIPALSTALGRSYAGHLGRPIREEDLDRLYEMAMTVLFRLLFIAYGEDKGLLPYETSGEYRRHALKTQARALAERANTGPLGFDPVATDIWSGVREIFAAVDRGNTEWGVPAYNGGLFSSDPAKNGEGALLEALRLTNGEFGPALFSLLVDRSEDDEVFGPVDFRALSVREFGTIYEGLLESSLSVATTPLSLDREMRYVPASEAKPVVVRAGEVYLQNQSGARKATGSYFTKQFAVEHLLQKSLDPALDDHLSRLEDLVARGLEADAARAFFDFRCVDLAMGSGHFLVAAVDHIEAKLSTFLARRPLRNVQAELERLRGSARAALGPLGDAVEIEQSSLLRRQIARRCIYGLDINEVAVELARLGLWIHTFVPGLPLSFLNHNLVHGNSLTGIGTVAEAIALVDPESGVEHVSLWEEVIERWLAPAHDALRRLGRVADATAAEIEEAYRAQREAEAAVGPARQLFDLLVAHRAGKASLPDLTQGDLAGHPDLGAAESARDRLAAVHFPLLFPEVFQSDNPGFHCFVGNPPWEEVTVEAPKFWTRYFPGLMSLPQGPQRARIAQHRDDRPDLQVRYEAEVEEAEELRRVLLASPFPGMGTGDPDLYKAFAWRAWQLLRDGGRLGIVLPRSALMARGSAAWREMVLAAGQFEDVTMLLNNRRWVFEEVHPQYTVGLLSIGKGQRADPVVQIQGPFASLEQYRTLIDQTPTRFTVEEFRSATSDASFPLLPTPESARIFRTFLRHPRIGEDQRGSWMVRPVRELDATNDRREMLPAPDSTEGLWPVYSGSSFNLWEPDTGEYYAWAEPAHITAFLQDKRLRQQRLASSAFSAFPRTWALDPATLPCRRARIAFRDVTRATDTRTVITALAPPNVVIANQAPYLVWARGEVRDEAYLLGVLSSIPLDWYARRLVEIHLNFHIFNSLPVPRPPADDWRRVRIVEIAGRLAARDDRFTAWAAAVGVPLGSVSEEEKPELLAELDALVASLYGFSAADVEHIFETFHQGWNFRPRLAVVLEHLARIPVE